MSLSVDIQTGDLELDGAVALGLTLAEACKRAEDNLHGQVGDVVWTAIAAEMPAGARRVSESRFALREVVYEIRAQQASYDSSVLQVGAGPLAATWALEDFRTIDAKIDGAGRYTSVRVAVDPRLHQVAETVTAHVARYLADGYRRLQANMMRALLELDHRVAIRLYAELRGAFDDRIAARIALYALVEDGRAMYLFDPPAIQTALESARKTRPSAAASPLTLTALLASGWVNAEETLAVRAITEEHSVAVRLSDMYYASSPEYNVAEIGLYGETVEIKPLVRDGRVILIAGYPTDVRETVEPELVKLQPRLTHILGEYEQNLRRMIGQRGGGSHRSWDAYIAEMIGRILRGVYSIE